MKLYAIIPYVVAFLLLAVSGGTRDASGSVLPFIADDYETALAEAQRRNVPLFIENWAPW